MLAADKPEVHGIDASKRCNELKIDSVRYFDADTTDIIRTHHAKAAQNGNECARRIHEAPRVDQITNKTHDETSAGHIDPSGSESCKIHTTRN